MTFYFVKMLSWGRCHDSFNAAVFADCISRTLDVIIVPHLQNANISFPVEHFLIPRTKLDIMCLESCVRTRDVLNVFQQQLWLGGEMIWVRVMKGGFSVCLHTTFPANILPKLLLTFTGKAYKHKTCCLYTFPSAIQSIFGSKGFQLKNQHGAEN